MENFMNFVRQQRLFDHLMRQQVAEDILGAGDSIIHTTRPHQDDFESRFGMPSRQSQSRDDEKPEIEDIFANLLGGFSEALSDASDELRQLSQKKRDDRKTPVYLSDEEVEKQIRPLIISLKTGEFEGYLEQVNKISNTYSDIKGKPAFAFDRAIEYGKADKICEAIVLYHIVCKLSIELYIVDESRLLLMQRAVSMIATWSRVINLLDIKNNCVLIIEDIIKDMQAMTKGDKKERSHLIAWCYKSEGFALFYLEKYKKAGEVMNKGVAVMKKEFGEEKKDRHVYGLLLSSVAICYMKQGMFEKAQPLFKQAEEALSECPGITAIALERALQEIKRATEECRVKRSGEKRLKDLQEIMQEVESKLAPLMQAQKRKEYEQSFKTIAESMKLITSESIGASLLVTSSELMKKKKYYAAFATLHLTCKAILQIMASVINKNDHIQGLLASVVLLLKNFESYFSSENGNLSKMKAIAKDFYFPACNNIISGIFDLAKGYSKIEMLCAAAMCYKVMGHIFQAVDLDQKALSCFRDGVDVLERPEMKSVAQKYRIYGILKHLGATVLAGMGNVEEARTWALGAKQALEKSTDWENDDVKADFIKQNNMLMAKLCLYT